MRRIRLLPDLVIERLCGRAVTDPSLWSLTGLYHLEARGWWQLMLDCLDLDPGQLPSLSAAGKIAGRLTESASRQLHLPAGTPVAVGALDHLAGAIAVGNVEPGCASLSTGTASCAVVSHRDKPPCVENGVIGPHPGDPESWYALTWSGLSSTGLNWLARRAGGEGELARLLEAAGSISSGADGWTAVPRDANNGDAGFDFSCATADSGDQPSDAQAMRAILACITAEADRLLTEAAAGQSIQRVIAIGGGAQSDVWLQLLADHLGIPVVRPECIEASLAGAARLAALAGGRIENLATMTTPVAATFLPA